MCLTRAVGVAIVGPGTVGVAASRILLERAAGLRTRTGVAVELKAVVGRSRSRATGRGVPDRVFTTDLDTVLARDDVQIVVELVGGIDTAGAIVERALGAGKHVVTANKALLAERGAALFAQARAAGLSIAFEASCGGGIPIVRALIDGLVGDEFEALYGILNGTSNYILTQMIQRSESYERALSDAQAQGLAEADPTLDVGGTDAAHKLVILAALAFGTTLSMERIAVSGIDRLDRLDVDFGMRLGYVIKPLAVACRTDGGVTAWVGPAFVSRDHPLAWVNGPFNAISVYGTTTGHSLYYGRGAGGGPTAGAVVADIVSLARGSYQTISRSVAFRPDRNGPSESVDHAVIRARFYLRILVQDRPGVLANLGAVLAEHRVSIASLLQTEQAEGGVELVPVVITTHVCSEAQLRDALRRIDALPITGASSVIVPIVDEHPEAPV